MTTVLLITAAPTPWDVEERLGGNPMLPLTTDGEIALREALKLLSPEPGAVYTFAGNQACEQAAKLVAQRFKLRIRNSDYLEPISMGLWQGLTRDELRFRFPTVFPQWEESPLSVNPPEGESLEEAAVRFRTGLRKILRRNRDNVVALVLRPISLQVVSGILRGENLQAICSHLHQRDGIVNIEVPEASGFQF
jgi:broad specificity phosphatase PhoE